MHGEGGRGMRIQMYFPSQRDKHTVRIFRTRYPLLVMRGIYLKVHRPRRENCPLMSSVEIKEWFTRITEKNAVPCLKAYHMSIPDVLFLGTKGMCFICVQ